MFWCYRNHLLLKMWSFCCYFSADLLFLSPLERRSSSSSLAQSLCSSHITRPLSSSPLTQSPSSSSLTQSPSSSPLAQSLSSFRRSSSSSQVSQNTPKKTKLSPKKKENNPGLSKSKETKPQLASIIYSPKKQFGSMLEFVLNESRFFGELQSRCANLCTVTKYPGRSDALKVTAKEPKVSLPRVTTT